MSNMNRLTTAERGRIVGALVEGNSLRATARITGFARMTVEKLLRELGAACAKMQDEKFRNLPCKRIQCDEIWSFVYAKAKNVTAKIAEGHPDAGDVWTWTAIDADTKLVPSWLVGSRDADSASAFVSDLASRLRNRVQLTTDGYKVYLGAVEDAFGGDIDYAMLVKLYGASGENETRYSPAKCLGCIPMDVTGDPDPKHVSTSYVERQNLTMRMHMRRFTRLTNAFSKKVDNHAHSVALHYAYYNFVKIHQTLRVTPAMAAGVTNRLWEISDLVALLDQPSN
jgi:IS1 family transposase